MQGFWFGLIAVLWAGFFLLEGFDFGVGMLLPIVAKTDLERRIALRSIGPVWDGNEVWLLVAGGATFAAFPEWYASMFSGFYLAFALLLVGLILRGIGIEYRGKVETALGRQRCDVAIVVGSLLPALLLGVAFANFLRGVTMNSSHVMTGNFFQLLSPYALLGGLVTLSLFGLHGAVFLTLRTEGAVSVRARDLSVLLGPIVGGLTTILLVWSLWVRRSPVSIVVDVAILTALAVAVAASRSGHTLTAFVGTGCAAALIPVWAFAALWPHVLTAKNNSAWSLTVYNASSSSYTLTVMTVVALIFTPIVLMYQGWTYWIFRARVTGAMADGHEYGRVMAKARESAQAVLGAKTSMHTDTPPDDAQPPAVLNPGP